MAGEAAEQLTLCEAEYATDDRRQAKELASLICKSSAAIERFIEFCLQQALDLLSEQITLLWTLGIILRMRRDMTGAEMDEAMTTVLAGQEVEVERIRRRQWASTVADAAKFEELTRS